MNHRVRLLVGWLVHRLKGREVTLPRSYRGNCLIILPVGGGSGAVLLGVHPGHQETKVLLVQDTENRMD